jgi:predicted dehydrogenase
MTSLGIHAVDCMIHLCGGITEVDARSQRRALPFDIDDTTCMLFGFENGMTGYLATLAAGGRLWHVRVFGADGWAELRGMETLVKSPAGAAPEVIDYPPEHSLKAELEAFAAAARGGLPLGRQRRHGDGGLAAPGCGRHQLLLSASEEQRDGHP